jgi:hypothetical protein
VTVGNFWSVSLEEEDTDIRYAAPGTAGAFISRIKKLFFGFLAIVLEGVLARSMLAVVRAHLDRP